MRPNWKHLPAHIWLKVFNKLPYSDFQQVRSVCRDWKDIADVPELSRRSEFKIKDNNVEAIVHYMKRKTKYPSQFPFARNVHISIHMMPKNRTCLEMVLSKIRQKIECLTVAQQYIIQFLPADGFPNLRELTISHDLGYVPTNREVKFDYSKYPKLQSLELSNLGGEEQCSLLKKLLENKDLLKIRKLRLQYADKSLEDVILNVLRAFGKDLTMVHMTFDLKSDLTVKWDVWGEVFSQMPKLENVGLFGHCTSKLLQTLLSSIPDKAPMYKVYISGSAEISDQHVKFVLSKWSKSLKTLNLGSRPEVSYSGLQYLTCVKDNLQTLNLSYCDYVNRNELMDGLCGLNNDVLRQLYLNNMMGLDEELLCCVAQRYTNLKVLTLNNGNKAVTNHAISYVFEHMLHLQRLELNHCFMVSDKGLLGTRQRPFAVTRLHWLQALSIENTGIITNSSFRKFKFPYLREFHYGYTQNITARTMKGFIDNCPALEILTMTCCYNLDDNVVRHIYKNLKRLIILNIQNCPKVTPLSVEYLKRCKLLRELSISAQSKIHVDLMESTWSETVGNRKKMHCLTM